MPMAAADLLNTCTSPDFVLVMGKPQKGLLMVRLILLGQVARAELSG
jgi:hypothetical protein